LIYSLIGFKFIFYAIYPQDAIYSRFRKLNLNKVWIFSGANKITFMSVY
jgi:hypothetical protein